MAAKPTPGGSDGTYGTELNEFLDVGHDADGTHTKSQMLTDLGYSPTTYAGEESMTWPNGRIEKTGQILTLGASSGTITFGGVGTEVPFPNDIVSVQLTGQAVNSLNDDAPVVVLSLVTGIGWSANSSHTVLNWTAIGW